MARPKPSKAVTMRDVAREAAVSVATVSRVINGGGGVSDKLVKQVKLAMDELRYHPSSLARSFKIQRTMLVGVIVPLIDHPFYSRLAMAIEQSLFQSGYRAIICNAEEDENRERAYLEMLIRQRADGIIINSAAMSARFLNELEALRIPYVLIDRDLPQAECSKVFSDNVQGGYIGMEYLIQLGHRRIGLVGAPAHTEPIRRRIQGAEAALAAHKIDGEAAILVTGDTQLFDTGYRSAHALMEREAPPTAIFSLTDVTAVGVIHALSELGWTVPGDVSVLGYDDIPIARYMIPQLSTVAQPIIEMGETAVDLLFARLQDPDCPPQEAVLRTRLVPRQSTRAYAASSCARAPRQTGNV